MRLLRTISLRKHIDTRAPFAAHDATDIRFFNGIGSDTEAGSVAEALSRRTVWWTTDTLTAVNDTFSGQRLTVSGVTSWPEGATVTVNLAPGTFDEEVTFNVDDNETQVWHAITTALPIMSLGHSGVERINDFTWKLVLTSEANFNEFVLPSWEFVSSSVTTATGTETYDITEGVSPEGFGEVAPDVWISEGNVVLVYGPEGGQVRVMLASAGPWPTLAEQMPGTLIVNGSDVFIIDGNGVLRQFQLSSVE